METLVVGIVGALATLVAGWIAYRAAQQAGDQQVTQLTEQLETAHRQLDVSAVGMTNSELAAIDEILIQYPKLRACFYDGVEPIELDDLTDDDKERIKAIAARLVNGYAALLLQSRKDVKGNMIPAGWARATVAHRYGNCPPCCDHLMTYVEEYSYTGRHQLQLMVDGLKQAREAAAKRNDEKRVAQLTARIKDFETVETSLFNRLEEIHRKYMGSSMAVVAASRENDTNIK